MESSSSSSNVFFGVGLPGGILRAGSASTCAVSSAAVAATSSAVVCSTLISSLIFFTTSLMIQDGTEAPAVIPIRPSPGNRDVSSSDASATKKTLAHFSRQSSARCRLFALCAPPMTIIASHIPAREVASLCLLDVAPHIVSNILKFVHLFFNIFSAKM